MRGDLEGPQEIATGVGPSLGGGGSAPSKSRLVFDLIKPGEDSWERKGNSAEQRGEDGVLSGRDLRRPEGIPVESENLDGATHRIDDPVLAHASARVERPLGHQIVLPV